MNSNFNCQQLPDSQVLAIHIANLSPKTVAQVMGVAESEISRWRSGERKLSIQQFVKLISQPSTTCPAGLRVIDRRLFTADQDEARFMTRFTLKFLAAREGAVVYYPEECQSTTCE